MKSIYLIILALFTSGMTINAAEIGIDEFFKRHEDNPIEMLCMAAVVRPKDQQSMVEQLEKRVTKFRPFDKDILNGHSEDGLTAMHLAAAEGNLPLIMWLSDQGADLNVRDERTRAPIHLAAGKNNLTAVAALLDCGAQIDSVTSDDTGRITPMHIAAYGQHTGMITLLTRRGANLKAITSVPPNMNRTGLTPQELFESVQQEKQNKVAASVLTALATGTVLFSYWSLNS